VCGLGKVFEHLTGLFLIERFQCMLKVHQSSDVSVVATVG
jgi:hypothetical protein